jgi:hypothetical protein
VVDCFPCTKGDTGKVLMITKTETSDGLVSNERAVFDKDQP